MSIPPESPSEHNAEAPEEEFQSGTHHPPAPSDEVIHENVFITPEIYQFLLIPFL